MTILIDSNIVIWGIKKQCTPGQENMIISAERFFDNAQENKIDILIPTPVVAEILSPEPKEKHADILKTINRYYIVVDFDIGVAQKTAELLMNRSLEITSYLEENKVIRDKMKFDHAILASALIYGANCIYSHDKDIKIIAQDAIPVLKLSNQVQSKKIKDLINPDLFGELVKTTKKRIR